MLLKNISNEIQNINLSKICNKFNVKEITKLIKGFSKDEKYILKSINNQKYILRLSNIKLLEFRKKQCDLLSKLDNTITCSKILYYGIFDKNYCFFVTSFLSGSDAIEIIKLTDKKKSYMYGIKAGKLLKKWHETSINVSSLSWNDIYKNKKEQLVKSLLECEYSLPLQKKLLNYLEQNLYLLNDRPLVFCHGDFHLGNMIIDDEEIRIIDVLNCSLADPYEEFKRCYWSIIDGGYFQTGLINGYFENDIPQDFFKILKIYTIESMITFFLKAIKIGNFEEYIKFNEKQLEWWGDFDFSIPIWYKGILYVF